MKKVVVFIPAYNEERNLRFLIEDILKQKESFFILTKILVVSDGSTDGTVASLEGIDDERLQVLHYQKNLGKNARVNEVFKLFHDDILIQLDADIRLSDENVLMELVRPFLEDSRVAMVCGRHKPRPPGNFIQRLALFGIDVWETAKGSLGASKIRYQCTGDIRAFSSVFAENFQLPQRVAEDVYSFYYAQSKGLLVVSAPRAVVLFNLNSSFRDYVLQMRRFLKAGTNLKNFFDDELLRRYETMTNIVKYRALFVEGARRPWLAIPYVVLQTVPKLLSIFYKPTDHWEVIHSSKVGGQDSYET